MLRIRILIRICNADLNPGANSRTEEYVTFIREINSNLYRTYLPVHFKNVSMAEDPDPHLMCHLDPYPLGLDRLLLIDFVSQYPDPHFECGTEYVQVQEKRT